MIERVLLTGLLVVMAVGLFMAWRAWQKRKIGRVVLAKAQTKPAVLYFRGDSCPTCPTQGRFLEKLRADLGLEAFDLQTIDAERDRDTAVRFGILSLPTTIILDPRGDVKHINYGLTNHQKLAQQLENIA
jgi:thioredoxin-like negative regulator of GroEL